MKQPTTHNPDPYKSYEVILGKGVKVITDKRSGTRVINLPFEFPDESPGVIIICKVKNREWVPSDDIFSVNLNFKQP